MQNTIKRHLISFLVTFSAMFILTLAPALYTGITNGFEVSIVVGIIAAAARSAFKMAYEFAIIPLMNIFIEWSKKNVDKNS